MSSLAIAERETVEDEGLGALALLEDNYSAPFKPFLVWTRAHGGITTPTTIRGYFLDLNDSGLAASTVNVRRAAVKARLRKAARGIPLEARAKLEAALTDMDRDPETRPPKVTTRAIGIEKVVHPVDYKRLIEKATPRQAGIVRFLYRTGLRASELCSIRLDDCRLEPDRVIVRVNGKGGRERKIKIRRDLYDRTVATFHGETYLFETESGGMFERRYVSRIVARLAARHLGRHLSAHCMRHSYATLTIQRTNKIEATSRALGHSTTSTTMNMYVHQAFTDEELLDYGEND